MSFRPRTNRLRRFENRFRALRRTDPNLIRPEKAARAEARVSRQARAEKRISLARAHFAATVAQPEAAKQTGVSISRAQVEMFDTDVASSLLWRLRYNEKTLELDVWFNDGAIYRYFNVPFDVLLEVVRGSRSPKTQGENEYGAWWETKTPSIGATFVELIVKGGYRYVKLGEMAARPRVLRSRRLTA